MNWAKLIVLAFFALGLAIFVNDGVKAKRWGAGKGAREAFVSAAIFAILGTLTAFA